MTEEAPLRKRANVTADGGNTPEWHVAGAGRRASCDARR